MLFLTNDQVNKAEITILSARDTTRPGFQSGASWVAVKGYIRKGITRECHLGHRTNRVLYFARFVCLILCLGFSFSGAFQFGRISCSIFSLL